MTLSDSLSSSDPNKPTDPDTLLNQLSDFRVDRLPIVSAFCHKIGIAQSINTRIDSKADIDAGTIVTAMILDTLSGRTPLYRFHDFFKEQDTELLLGHDIAAHRFTDDALGRTLDRLHEAGTMKIFTEASLKACRIFKVDTSQGQFDTTSVNLWGNYDCSKPGEVAPYITHGFSKDKRPDLKQFMFSLLCVEGNIPLLGKVEDGNASDLKLNNEELQQVAKLIAENKLERENFLYVADCKLVSEENLKLLGDNPFVTRLPASYKAHDGAIDKALELDQWEEVGALNQTPDSRKRPAASYKICQQKIDLYGRDYRAIVVHSSNHDKRRQKRIERQLEKARQGAEKAIKKGCRDVFACEKDARAALEKIQRDFAGELWKIGGEIVIKEIYASGKVAKGQQRKVRRVDYRLQLEAVENRDRIELFRKRAGCFVLLSNAPKALEPGAAKDRRTWNALQCLQAYKEQHGVENSFSFLKDPLIVNDVFLKKPGRIDALGLVLLLSLLVWSLMQRCLRKSIQQQPDLRLTDLDNKPTQRPTSFIMVHKFLKVTVLKIGENRRLSRPLSFDQGQYLIALGLKSTVFTTPPKTYIHPIQT